MPPSAGPPSRRAIVAVARLSDVRPSLELETTVSAIERLYGNYAPGRYGWILADVRALAAPIPCRGAQGLFDVPELDAIIAACAMHGPRAAGAPDA